MVRPREYGRADAAMETTLTLTSGQQAELRRHLFPDDGCEAVALILCGRRADPARHRLVARRVVPVPYDACSVRCPTRVTWSTGMLPPLLEEAARLGLALMKVHGHREPSDFSETDDKSDMALFPSVCAWTGNGPHGSAVMFADGRMIARTVDDCGRFTRVSSVNVVGDDLPFWPVGADESAVPEFGRRVAQTFGAGTYELLRRLRVAVIGCSGTGSPAVEQLARNSVGSLVLVDPDRVEAKNLNRILNATRADARNRRFKVDVLARAISKMGLGTVVETYPMSLFDARAIKAVASCDVVLGCMDSIDGRHLLNKLATFYLLPYFDLGVKIEADGCGRCRPGCRNRALLAAWGLKPPQPARLHHGAGPRRRHLPNRSGGVPLAAGPGLYPGDAGRPAGGDPAQFPRGQRRHQRAAGPSSPPIESIPMANMPCTGSASAMASTNTRATVSHVGCSPGTSVAATWNRCSNGPNSASEAGSNEHAEAGMVVVHRAAAAARRIRDRNREGVSRHARGRLHLSGRRRGGTVVRCPALSLRVRRPHSCEPAEGRSAAMAGQAPFHGNRYP